MSRSHEPHAKDAGVAARAAELHAAAVAASDDGQPALAVRRLRAGLQLVADPAPGAPDPEPTLAALRSRLLLSLAWAESERGRVELGFRLLDEAEAGIPADLRGALFGQRALLLKRSGRHDEAIGQFDAAVAALSERTAALDLVKALNNRALLHLDAGHVGLARADLRRAGPIAARHRFIVLAAIIRLNLACLDVLVGDLPSALRRFGAVRREYEVVAPGRLANLAVERSRALLAAGLFAEADRELAMALDRAAEQQLSHTYADALLTRAEAALLAGRASAAARWAAQARGRFLGRDNARRAAVARLVELRAEYVTAAGAPEATGVVAVQAANLVTRLTRLGLAEDALVARLTATRALVGTGQIARGARTLGAAGSPRPTDRLDTRLLWRLTRAELAAATGRPAEASRHLIAGMTALHRYRARFGCLDLQTGAAVHGQDLARTGLRAALATGSPAGIFRWSERARAQALLLPPARPPDDPGVASALEELRQVRHQMRAAELAGRPVAALRSRSEALQRALREHAWGAPGGGGRAPSAPTLAMVSAELRYAAMVVYLRADAALSALVITGTTVGVVPLCRYADAAEAVFRLRADLDAGAGRAMPRLLAEAVDNATHHDARVLAAAVLDPILPLVGDRDLVVVPTGVLVTVPWAGLPGCAGRPVTVTPSATSWITARRRARAGTGALLVAGPGTSRGPTEVRSIAALYPDATVLTDAAATPDATLPRLADVSLAHLAAHGHHNAENPLFSSLDLTGGPLTGYDLQRLPATPPTVVLSSCDLGLTDVRPGDETFGMVTALLCAGTSTVVASVSRVADETAMAVMTAFHRALHAGRPADAALAAAAPLDERIGFVCFGTG